MEHNSSRRKALKNLMLSTMAGTTLSSFAEVDNIKTSNALKGNINHLSSK